MLRKVYQYPDNVPETQCYSTQKEAVDNSERRPNSKVFSFEVSLDGSRRYLVTTLPHFWEWYKDKSVRNYYEVICEGSKSKLYCDLEFKKIFNQGKDGFKCVQRLIQLINYKASLKNDHDYLSFVTWLFLESIG